MGDYSKKLGKKAAAVLAPDERLLAASRAMGAGGLKAITLGAAAASLGGAATMMAADRLTSAGVEEGRADAEAAGFPYATSMVLALTDRRFIVWDRSVWTGRARRVIGEVPLDRVTSLEAVPGKIKHELTLTFGDGSAITLDVVKLDGVDGFQRAWSTLR